MTRLHYSEQITMSCGDLADSIPRYVWRTFKATARRALHPAGKLKDAGQRPISKKLRSMAVGLAALASSLPFATHQALAQEAGILASGDLVITGFSGTQVPADGSIDNTFIDVNGASLKIFPVGTPPFEAQNLGIAPKFEAFASDIGQVFGVALDDASPPNIYATATSAHGLQIVSPSGGAPVRIRTGQPGATFMDGQFGINLGGGPGSVWKIDGITGMVSLFANIESGGQPNSGPGLGNIAYDPAHYQLYVSDMDTGVIHRLGMAGNDLGTFDHGTQGLTGPDVVMIDPANRMDITAAAFDAENSDTWGFADPRRLVWGLAYHGGRLYYGVEEGPKIWSVGIAADGSFANDARVEIELVPGGFPVSDILFTSRGRMVLAQRGGILGSYDYTQYHTPMANQVLRYGKDSTGNWVPEPDEYAIGFPVDHKNASGGVALSCSNKLWSTGDALRDDPALIDRLAAGGEAIVHGVQGNNISLVRPRNVPPWSSVFVDYDGQFADPEKAGHVGDVEVYRLCEGGRYETWPGWTPGWTPPPEWIPPPWWPREPDLEIEKSDSQCSVFPGVVFNVYNCTFTITVTNVGAAIYVGNLNVIDDVPPNMTYMPPPGGSIPWNCAQPGGSGTPINCTSQNVETLLPGESETLEITIQSSAAFDSDTIHNCAIIDHPNDPGSYPWPGDPNGNNEDCGDGYPPGPDLEMLKTLNMCIIQSGGTMCSFWLDVTNVGTVTYTGPLQIIDFLPPGSTFVGMVNSSDPGWNCLSFNPGEVDCRLPGPVTMNPGDWHWVEIQIFIPSGAGGDLENCVQLGPDHADDPDIDGNNRACEPFTVPEPEQHTCPAGSLPVPPGGAPADWQEFAVEGVTPDGAWWGIMCMVPKDVHLLNEKMPSPERVYCPKGWRRFSSSASVPQGWTQRRVGKGKLAIICARYAPPPPTQVCPKGWREFPTWNAVPQGWTKKRVGKLICAKPQPQSTDLCPKGYTKFPRNQAPSGWITLRRYFDNGRSVCAKPKPQSTDLCPKGYTKFPRNQAPSGWMTLKRYFDNGRSVCAKPRILQHCPKGYTGKPPNCHQIRQHCPKGYTGKPPNCRQILQRCPKGYTGKPPNCRRIQQQCPKGYTGKPPNCRKIVQRCPKGYTGKPPNCRKVGTYPLPQTTPGIKLKVIPKRIICPAGQVVYRGRCVRPLK